MCYERLYADCGKFYYYFRQEGLAMCLTDKKNLCKYDDYIQPKPSLHSSPIHSTLLDFKLDRIFPKNINIKLNPNPNQPFKFHTENKFYHEYMNAKEMHNKASKKNKIAHIFNIRSINLVEKTRADGREQEKRAKNNYAKEIKHSLEKDLRGLNLILVEKRTAGSPKRLAEKKNSMPYMQKIHTEHKSLACTKTDNNFQTKLAEYHQCLKETASLHGLTLRQVQTYSRNSLIFHVGRGNNGHLIKELLKKRWWWTLSQEKSKRLSNFSWTQLKQKSYFLKEERSKSSLSHKRDSQSRGKEPKNESTELLQEVIQTKIHNHFENNEFLGNKKALYYNMKAYYERNHLQVFNYLPVTFHVKRFGDEAWLEFSKYYGEDQKTKKEGEQRLWIVKPGENSNRGNGITIYSDFDKIKAWVQAEISGENNPKKTFIIQKYIDRPLLYNKRKFDIRCYMLLVRLNGKTRGYWYNQGYIRTSCYEFQLGETDNEFIHLTNDAIQVNSQKYGKYEDGNKLSYHHFQKYLDSSQKHLNLNEQICPQLKEICRHAIQATYHLLGKWNGLPTFEVFGLDFMIDEDCKPWLIEINTNPCLQTSSTTLERVIPRMVDNAFKLSLDVLFPPPQTWQNSKKHHLPNRAAHNLFQLVFDQAKTCPNPNREVILEMGEIQEDNQVYEQQKEKKATPIDFNT